jgi:DNA helicase II / ATP-dependent DNA helicase PcrA
MILSEEQTFVVESKDPVTICLAGAGSGKTRVVVSRIDWLMRQNYSSSDIYAISFTRKSGRELQERLSPLSKNVWCGTLHSLCLDVCQRNDGRLFVISEAESDYLLEDCGRSLGMVDSVSGKWHEKTLDFWKDVVNACRQGEEPKSKTGKRLADMYESKLRIGGDCDYHGLLLRALKYIEDGCMSHIRHLFVDEAQDIDDLQWKIIDTIVSKGNKCAVTIVGDKRQNIFSWRGANPNRLDRPGNLLYLRDNYRCPEEVVKSANKLIGLNPEGNVPMNPLVKEGSLEIRTVLPEDAINYYLDMFTLPGEMAVLCRTNREADVLAMVLSGSGVEVFRPLPPSQNCPVNAILAYGTRQQSPSAWSLFNRTIGAFIEVPPTQEYAALRMGGSLCDRTRAVGKALEAASMPYAVVNDCLRFLADHFDLTGWDRFAGYPIQKALQERNMMDDSEDEQGNRVAVMTIHQAKGLEWPVVIVPSMNQGNLPVKSSLRSEKLLDEERRLAYVAWTRAKEILCICVDDTRPVSQFIKEGIDDDKFGDRRGVFEFIESPF